MEHSNTPNFLAVTDLEMNLPALFSTISKLGLKAVAPFSIKGHALPAGHCLSRLRERQYPHVFVDGEIVRLDINTFRSSASEKS